MIYNSIDELVGGTPMLRLRRLEEREGLDCELLAKLEMRNPAGSVKDRTALFLRDDALKSGRLKPGGTVIEPTSGSTGISLCALCVPMGVRVILVMPENMSDERKRLLAALGGEVHLTPTQFGMAGAVQAAEQLHRELAGSVMLRQFENPANAAAHEQTTGRELWQDCGKRLAAVVLGVGTGGTLTGVGRYLKRKNSDVQIVSVEPAGSAVLSGGVPGTHGIQGIGAGFVPKIFDPTVCNKIISVTDEQAQNSVRLLAQTEGILPGISGGAALSAAVQLAKTGDFHGKQIAVILPDGGERYLGQ